MRPDVSVVIPTYNRRSMVQEAIESCFAGNDEIDVEVVVVDDGSTDGTRSYLESFEDGRVRPIFQEHQGAQVARNKGQRAARGRAIKHLDDDDYLPPGALERQYHHLQQTGVDASYGNIYVIDERDEQREYIRRWGRADTLFGGLTSLSLDRLQWAYLFQREAIQGVEWDESLKSMQDVKYMYDVASRHITVDKISGNPVVVHRAHDNWRVTDVRNKNSRATLIDFRCRCIYETCQKLIDRAPSAEWKSTYRLQGAQGVWHEAHKVAPHRFDKFKEWYKQVQMLDSSYAPDRSNCILSWMDQLFSPYFTERIINPFRYAKSVVLKKLNRRG